MEILVPQIREQSFAVIKMIPQERVSVRIAGEGENVDLPVPHIMKEIAEVAAEVPIPQSWSRLLMCSSRLTSAGIRTSRGADRRCDSASRHEGDRCSCRFSNTSNPGAEC